LVSRALVKSLNCRPNALYSAGPLAYRETAKTAAPTRI
jgi:hypothetical protein